MVNPHTHTTSYLAAGAVVVKESVGGLGGDVQVAPEQPGPQGALLRGGVRLPGGEGGEPGGGQLQRDVLPLREGRACVAEGGGQVTQLVLQKGPSEANPKIRNHGEGPY